MNATKLNRSTYVGINCTAFCYLESRLPGCLLLSLWIFTTTAVEGVLQLLHPSSLYRYPLLLAATGPLCPTDNH